MNLQSKRLSYLKIIGKCMFFALLAGLIFSNCQKEAITNFEEEVTTKKDEITTAKKQLRILIEQKGLTSKLTELENSKTFSSSKKSTSFVAQSRNSSNYIVKDLAENESFQYYRNLVKSAINPDDYECGPTFLNDYFVSITQSFTEDDFFFMNNFGIIALFEGVVFDATKDEDYFGADGDFTSQLQKTFIKLKTFWDIPTDIQLSDAHGAVFKNPTVVAELLKLFFVGFDENGNPVPISDSEAIEFAELLKLVFSAPVFEDYNHPLFTFNAFALNGIPELGVGKKIVMGDGIMEAYAELGLRTMADRFILAHEYGHHIQFANGYFEDGPIDPAEATRRTELMADAYASYFLSHGKGEFIQSAMIRRFVKTSFSIGDCAFFNPGHHGTPNQRAKAADFGGKLAKRRGFIDQVYSSQEFFELFEEALPEIIAPDAE